MEAWEKVYIDGEAFLQDVHATPGCIACHGGTPETVVKGEAHVGLAAKASANPQRTCGSCHPEYAELARTSAHRLLPGYLEVLKERGADFTNPTLVTAYNNHCTSCHASCGDCHISRPSALGGGLLAGHQVKKVASVWLTCGGCHSARVADDYRGNHEGIPADVHWQKAGMACTKCHTADDYHARGHGTRYDGDPEPGCQDCHPEVQPGTEIAQHDSLHLGMLSCQVCHSAGAVKSCFGCHTGVDDQGIKYFRTEGTEMTFKIGLNPLQSPERPWAYAPVRHAPAAPGLYDFYAEGLLSEFDAVPTWKYATPHNIQRNTPQNASCTSCHGQDALFLRAEDVDPATREANRSVIVPPDRLPAPLPVIPGVTAPATEEGG